MRGNIAEYCGRKELALGVVLSPGVKMSNSSSSGSSSSSSGGGGGSSNRSSGGHDTKLRGRGADPAGER